MELLYSTEFSYERTSFMDFKADYDRLADKLAAKGISVEDVKAKLKAQHIETPSWGYGNGGTRFKVFAWEGAARNIYEKIDDAAYIHKLSGIAPSIAIRRLSEIWDAVKTNDVIARWHSDNASRVNCGFRRCH
jgi:L-rhamnose isomerase